MDELEQQLRRLADHRAAQVAPASTDALAPRRRLPRRWLAAAAIVLIGGVAGAIALANRDNDTPLVIDGPVATGSTTTPPGSDAVRRFASEQWGLSFEAPANWDSGPQADSWGGPDGFLVITAHDATGTIDDVAAKAAQVEADRWERTPEVSSATVDGQDARLVGPITMGPDALDGVQVVVGLPRPRQPWALVVVTIDVDHVDTILPTLRWVEQGDTRTVDGFGFTVDVPATWTDVDFDGERWGSGAAGPDGHASFGLFDQADRSPFIDRVPNPLPELDVVVADLVVNFPADYGTGPTVEPVTIDGRPGWRISPSTDGTDVGTVSYIAEPPRASARFVELTIDTDHAEAIITSLVWDEIPPPPPCTGPAAPTDATLLGQADVDGDGVADRLLVWSSAGGIQITAEIARGTTNPTSLGDIAFPDLLAVVDLDGGGDELFVTGPGNTARNALVLTLGGSDGCSLEMVNDDSGEPFLALVGIGGNSCAPTGCRPIVACFQGDGPELLTAVLGPDESGSFAWQANRYRMGDGTLQLQWEPWSFPVDVNALPDDWNAYEDTVACPVPETTDAERAMVADLLAWVVAPDGPPPLPLADRVGLGLVPTVVRTADGTALADPSEWVLDVEEYNAYAGPFDLLEPLRRPGEVAVTVGPHMHCASPPWPEPAQLFGLRRLSIQPTTATSCLEWFALDLFVDDAGLVHGVALELYAP